MLLIELVPRGEGLESADPELARYALDLHELGPKNIIVVPDDPTNIVRRPFSPPPPFFFLKKMALFPHPPPPLLACINWQSASLRHFCGCAPTPPWPFPPP